MMSMGVKKLSLIIIFAGFSSQSYAQTGIKKTLSFEGGVGANAYQQQTSQDFGKSIAASWDFNFTDGYYFHDRVNLNNELEAHNYITGEESDSSQYVIDYVGSYRAGVGLKYAIIDKPKYQLSIGGSVGGFNFNYNISDSANNASFKANGVYQPMD